MSPEAQRIAIAEACGHPSLQIHMGETAEAAFPDYLNDLNAMHEAEKTIPNELRMFYWRELLEAVTPVDYTTEPGCDEQTWAFINAKPNHRAKAFLKAHLKWDDTK